MRSLFLFLLILFALTQTANAKDSDCWKKSGEKAIKACSKIIQSNRFSGKKLNARGLSTIYFNRGNAFKDKFNLPKAIADYNEAVRLNPKYVNPYISRGRLNHSFHNYKEAIADFTFAISLKPEIAQLYVWRAESYLKKRDYNKSIEDYSKSISFNHKLSFSYSGRGDAHQKAGNFEKALKDYQRAIKLNETRAAKDINAVVLLLVRMGKFSEAISYSEKYPNVKTVELMNAIARAFFYLGDSKEAHSTIIRAVTYIQSPFSTRFFKPNEEEIGKVYDTYGQILLELGKSDKSFTNFDKALKHSPQLLNSIIGRADVYLIRSNYLLASEEYDRYFYHRKNIASRKLLNERLTAFEKDQINKKYARAKKNKKIALAKLRGENRAVENELQEKQKVSLVPKRIALVIGNDDYKNLPNYSQLKKARSDARSTAETFTSLGFNVVSGFNLKRRDMNVQLTKFANKINPGDEVMFFFAGHGVRIEGQNYLLPSDIPPITDANEDLLKAESLRVDAISDLFRKKGARLSLLVLDACRNNPYKDSRGRSVGGTRGLAPMDPPEGTLVLFSAGAGQEALDRLSDDDENPNSVFTRTFLPMVKQEGLELSRLSRLLKAKVRELAQTVGHKQTPAVYNEVIGDVYLAKK